jgi:hypothetical protein
MSTVLEPLVFDPEKRWVWNARREINLWFPALAHIPEEVFHQACIEAHEVVDDSEEHARNHAKHTNEPPLVRRRRTRNNYMAQWAVADWLGLPWEYKKRVWMGVADVGEDIDVACTDHLANKAMFREDEREIVRLRRNVFVWILQDVDRSWWAVGMGWAQGDEFMATGTRCGAPGDYHWYIDPRELREMETLR